jgi:hypothetical protein
MAVIGAEKMAMADEVGGGMSWKRDPKKAVQGGLFFELESTPGTAGNDMSLQPDENLPAFPSFQPVPEPTREPAHSGSFLCSKIREKSPLFRHESDTAASRRTVG